MLHRINDKNFGNSKLDSQPKKKSQKLNLDEYTVLCFILEKVYDAMQDDEITQTFTDGGRITLSLTGEQMLNLFEAKSKLNDFLPILQMSKLNSNNRSE
jgi:hypothetical protein